MFVATFLALTVVATTGQNWSIMFTQKALRFIFTSETVLRMDLAQIFFAIARVKQIVIGDGCDTNLCFGLRREVLQL